MTKFLVTYKSGKQSVFVGTVVKFFSDVCTDAIGDKRTILLNANEVLSVEPEVESGTDK